MQHAPLHARVKKTVDFFFSNAAKNTRSNGIKYIQIYFVPLLLGQNWLYGANIYHVANVAHPLGQFCGIKSDQFC